MTNINFTSVNRLFANNIFFVLFTFWRANTMPFGLYALHSYLNNCIRWNYTIIIIIIKGVFYGPSGLSVVSFTMIKEEGVF